MSHFTLPWGCVFCCFSLCLIALKADSKQDCLAKILFPSLDVSLDDDNTPTTVHFEVVSKCNADLSDFRLDILTSAGNHPDMKSGKVLCVIRPRRHNVCGGTKTASGLSCHATETFPRQLHRTWRVEGHLDGESISNKTVVFYVSYPTILKTFTVPSMVNKKDDVQLRCKWEAGNSQRRIVLRGPGNKVLKNVSAMVAVLEHSIQSADCSASGQYRCEVEGTRQFKNATLLVKCPLMFRDPDTISERSIQTGRDAKFSFNITSYTADITSCQLTTPAGAQVKCEGDAKSEATVRGSPPNFALIVTLRNVAEQDAGNWTLTAASGEDHDTVSFRLSVTTPGAQKGSPYQLVIIGGACGGGVLVIVAVVIIICLCRRRRKPCTKTSAPAASNTQPVSSGDDTEFNSHIYDEPHSPATVAPAPSVEVNARSSKADSSSDDYLEPIPGPAELAGAYESLEMAEVGQRSVYSQITTHGKWKKFLLRKK